MRRRLTPTAESLLLNCASLPPLATLQEGGNGWETQEWTPAEPVGPGPAGGGGGSDDDWGPPGDEWGPPSPGEVRRRCCCALLGSVEWCGAAARAHRSAWWSSRKASMPRLPRGAAIRPPAVSRLLSRACWRGVAA